MKYKDKEWLEKEYVDNRRSMKDIADELQVSAMTVRKYIMKFEFKVRSKGEQRSLFYTSNKEKNDVKLTRYSNLPKNILLKDKKWLEKEYILKNKSLREIAKLCNISSRRPIVRALELHSIPVRDLKNARKARSIKGPEFRNHTNPDVNNLKKLKAMYESGQSLNSMKKKLKVGRSTIKRRLSLTDTSIRKPWIHRIGKNHSSDTKKKMSDIAAQQIKDGIRSSHVNSTRPTILLPDGRFVVTRSSYEKHYGEWLKQHDIPFTYESCVFDLKNGTSYIPDFYLSDTDEFIEIKGYLSDDQNAKYELFRKLYPDVKWKLLFKKDLEDLGIKLGLFKKVYMICGVSGSGKSWVCNQLSELIEYVSFDGNSNKYHVDLIRSIKGNVLYDPTINISTFIRRNSHEFDIRPIFIIENEDVIRKRIEKRNGKWKNSMLNRMNAINSRSNKYGEFSGTSSEVLQYLEDSITR